MSPMRVRRIVAAFHEDDPFNGSLPFGFVPLNVISHENENEL